jgi:hypothetical protein
VRQLTRCTYEEATWQTYQQKTQRSFSKVGLIRRLLYSQSNGISVVVPSCRIVELDSDTAQLLGDAQISIGGLAKPETKFWYAEPREFLDKLAALSIPVPDAEKCLSAVGIAFFARVCGPGMEDLLVPVGKVAFWELRG